MGEKENVGNRQHRSKQERRAIVEASLRSGASVAAVARAHGVRPNHLFHWRKLYNEGRLGVVGAELLPVRIAEAEPHASRIDIAFGKVRIQLEGAIDHESLRVILEHIAR